MANTPNYDFQELLTTQAQKEITHNYNLREIDALLGHVVVDSISQPTGAENDGEVYIVSAGTGTFASHDNDLAVYVNGLWSFKTAYEGQTVWRASDNMLMRFEAGSWRRLLKIDNSAASTVFTIATSGNETVLKTDNGNLVIERTTGQILFRNLPASDPGVSGAVYVSAGYLKISP